MANEYVKTSKEELTAMADELRTVGPFQEGQQFVFPSSEYDENPVYTFKIVESGAWSEITRTEADELIEQGYDTQEVEEFPAVGEAAANTVYFTVQRQLGFAEAYKKAIISLYQKIVHGTLTQEDVEGLVLDNPQIDIFSTPDYTYATFSDITYITVTARWLADAKSTLRRLGNLEEIIILDSENVTLIGDDICGSKYAFTTIKCSPTTIGSYAFYQCDNLIVGPDYLNLEKCESIEEYGLSGISQTDSLSLPKITYIGDHTFYLQNLSKIYLPDIPPTLQYSTGTFSNDIIFYVSTDDVLTTYSTAENWSYYYNNNRIKSLEAEANSNGSNQS